MPEDSYLVALGRAVYSVAYTEWLVIEVARRLDPSLTLEWMAGQTTGTIAAKLRAAVTLAPIDDVALKSALSGLAEEWSQIVAPRNDVIHARPATAEDGAQRLVRWAPGLGVETRFITSEVLADLSARALAVSSQMSRLREQLPKAVADSC